MVNPRSAHALAVGIDQPPLTVAVRGSVGYYCAGMNDGGTVTVHGSAGPGVAENMMAGSVVIEGDASQYAGATGQGGLLVIKAAASRCGISMKGIDIVVHGSIGHMSAFMAQSGNLVVLGDAGEALGDSLYEARLFVRGGVKASAPTASKEMRPRHPGDPRGSAGEGRGGRQAGRVRRLRLGPHALQFQHRQRRRVLRAR